MTLGRKTLRGRGFFERVEDGKPPILLYHGIAQVTATEKRSRLRRIPMLKDSVVLQARSLKRGDPVFVLETTDWAAPGLPNWVESIQRINGIDDDAPLA